MKVTLLGTGTSFGVPQIGCTCEVCQSTDPRDKRLRCSALVEEKDTRILIDCTPDFRQQMLRLRISNRLDAVLVTHEHYDHVGGIDDLRPFTYHADLPIYADNYAITHLRQRLPYCLVENHYPGVPQLTTQVVKPGQQWTVGCLTVTAIGVVHGKLPILGYRIGEFAYITDMSKLPQESFGLLQGIRALVVNGLRHTPHATHQTIEEAIALSRQLHPALPTYLIHMSHHIRRHAEEEALLPDSIYLGYDGQEINIP